MANQRKMTIVSDVNGQPLVAHPGDDAAAVVARFEAMRDDSTPEESALREAASTLGNIGHSVERLIDSMEQVERLAQPSRRISYDMLRDGAANVRTNLQCFAVETIQHVADAQAFLRGFLADPEMTREHAPEYREAAPRAQLLRDNMQFWVERRASTGQAEVWKQALDAVIPARAQH